MGLDMYMCKSTKDNIAKQSAIDDLINALGEKFPYRDSNSDMYKLMFDIYAKYNPTRVAYWRKVNFLHSHIVNTYAAGVDDCQVIFWTKGDATKILATLQRVLAICIKDTCIEVEPDEDGGSYHDKPNGKKILPIIKNDALDNTSDFVGSRWRLNDAVADEVSMILPTQGGFFFGSTVYDIWYISDVADAVRTFKSIVNEWDDDAKYWYEASW